MRKQVLFTALVAFLNLALLININAQGPMPSATQASACTLPADAGGQMQAVGGMVCETPDPMLINNIAANIEYVITDSDNILTGTAADGVTTFTGPAIVGFDDDGIFNPADYGFADGDEFCVTAIVYNLSDIQAAVDMIFGSSSGVNCCSAIESTLAQEVCTPLCDAGICSGSDVTSFNSLLDLLAAFGASPLVEGMVDVIENSINTQAGSGLPCTEEFPICWAVSASSGVIQSVCYTYDASQCEPMTGCGMATGLTSTLPASGLVPVTLSWDAITDAQAYQMAGRKAGGTWKVFPETTATSRTFNGGIQANTTYQWTARVKCAGTWTDWALPPAEFTTGAGKNAGGFDIFADAQNLAVELYPNPANTTATLQISAGFDLTNTATTYNVQVMDMMGRTINSFTTDATNVNINVSDYADGYYFVSVDNGTEKTVKKMIIAQ